MILSTQRWLRGGDSILSTQRWLRGGDSSFIYTEICAPWRFDCDGFVSTQRWLRRAKLSFIPKRFLSWGFKTLFASASSCQCKPPHFSSPAGLCRVNLDRPRSSGRTRFWPSCSACVACSRNSLAATRSRSDFIYTEMAARRRFDFIYTEMAARRRFEFYLHRDLCAVEI